MSYKINPLKSKRDGIYKTKAQKAYIMPPPGTMVVVGSTGSGKTTIIGNLLSQKNMLKNYFDEIYIFCLSPCTTLIDNVKQIKEHNVFLEDDPGKLAELFNNQKSSVDSIGFKRAKHILFILDDIIQSNKFLNSKALSDIFFGGTHSKTSLWLLSQNYMSVPRRLRMNAHSLIICHCVNLTEIERFSTEWQSPYMNKSEFTKLVQFALTDAYSFLFVNGTHPDKKEMYRSGFGTILSIK